MTVTIVFALALSGAALNSTKQFNKTDNLNKATDLAEMGITYYQNVSTSLIQQAKDAVAKSTTPTNFCTEYINLLKNQDGTYNVDSNSGNKYKISLITTSACSDNLSEINVVFKSDGITKTNEDTPLQGSFNVIKQSTGIKAPDLSEYDKNQNSNSSKIYYGNFKHNDQPKDKIINKQAWFDSLDVVGNRTVTINNNAVFTTVNGISMNSHTNITVNGNAFFMGPDPKPAKPKNISDKQYICITGNIYYKRSDGTVEYFNDFSDYYYLEPGCLNPNIGNYSENWLFDSQNGIKVVYNPK
jgi:hypothetical protein